MHRELGGEQSLAQSLPTIACPAAHPPPAGKTHRELVELESGIQEQLDSGTAADPEYWQAVLKRLVLHKAKARLREIHAGGWAGWWTGLGWTGGRTGGWMGCTFLYMGMGERLGR